MNNLEREKQALLTWYKTLGVDVLFCPVPIKNDLENSTRRNNAIKIYSSNVYEKRHGSGFNNHKIIEEIKDLSDLYTEIKKLDCPIKRTARNTVISDGNPKSKIMLIGEAPGYDEDLQGKPFVGQSGALLNKMLDSVGIKREDVFISNVCYWRPPGNRNPSQDEIALCLPYVKCLIGLIDPKVIMLLGGVATHALLDTTQPISKLRGKLTEVCGIQTIPTYHPAYLLRVPSQKKLAYEDLKLLAQCCK